MLVVVLTVSEPAHAWGPAMHVSLAGTLLENLGLVPAAIAAILSRHAASFLYGNIAADVVFAKRLSKVRQFCHHWSTAFRLLDSAPDAPSTAFAYGYLSHLAADTVAHGAFVPHQILISGAPINAGHLYWELRADAVQDAATWQTLRTILADDHDEHHDALSGHLAGTLLSYNVNRFVFDRINAFTIHRGFRRSMAFVDRCSRWPISEVKLEGYRGECLERIVSVLSKIESSPVLKEDPNGTSAFMNLHALRKARSAIRRRCQPLQVQ